MIEKIIKKIKRLIRKIIKILIDTGAAISFFIIKPFIKKKPRIASVKDTVQQIKCGKSLARFGDGEFEAITCNIPKTSFQDNSLQLSSSIKKSFETNDPNLMIAISSTLSWDLSNINKVDSTIWKRILVKNWWKWKKEINIRGFYYNAYVTRPYFQFSQNYSISQISNIFNEFKQVWKNKNILLVEGKYTRFGINDDLLDTANKIERIICPPKDAFKKINSIESAIRNYIHNNDVDIILISLGPTASILTCNLIDISVQVLDIGHLDLEYNWFLSRAVKKITPIGKYNNEGPIHFVEFKDSKILSKYNSQIIKVID